MPDLDQWLDEPITDLGQLASALDGDETSFTGDLLRLIAKADPGNRVRLAIAFPWVVYAWERWMATRPPPTTRQIRDLVADVKCAPAAGRLP